MLGAERGHAWMNGIDKLRPCTEERSRVVDVYLSREFLPQELGYGSRSTSRRRLRDWH
ncbi:hypothetical protein M878_45230 [Streptomyces roseochromogenus subsp. oscitans DS 12.976]|uniref:Transposase n=1 Tax=Streptomyces roseochromogenus subsp. oscitans DS 12.976 TaxID=1352936 RepID=V6JH91_STRRC|nr:hypothetical protein M878_45230 [Streptomyces roseochromogenus subsp. oscitans DS 12.976]